MWEGRRVNDAAHVDLIRAGYTFDVPSATLGVLIADDQPVVDAPIRIPLSMFNRHGLVAGATGTGKTVTLQVMAEALSSAGVPVFAADIKGDLSGMATALLDETIQLYVPGRTSSVRDVWIDFGGVIAGLFVALLLLLIVRGLTSFHAMKKENRRLRAERAELLRQQRADRINTADDRPESPDRREYL